MDVILEIFHRGQESEHMDVLFREPKDGIQLVLYRKLNDVKVTTNYLKSVTTTLQTVPVK